MSSAFPFGPRTRTFLLWAAPLSVLGCGGGGTDVVLPALSVSTSTQGVEPDPDGYNLSIDGSQNQPVGVSATVIVERLPDGEHVLELGGLAANCSAGENPRTVSTRAGATATATFAVTCTATSGSVEVATVTTGGGSDPDGFLLTLDGAERGQIGTSATLSVAGVSPGLHSLGLSGLAGNCQVAGENPREITVVAGQTLQVPFSVTCVPAGPGTGTIEITTSTTGSDLDPDGYSVSVDGAAGQPLGPNARLTVSNVPSGAHRVDLLGIAANCSLSVPNPRRVTVTAGSSVTVAFAVNCAARPPETGAVRVSVSTSGASQDADGYTVSMDGGSEQSIAVNGSRTIQGLAPGQHSAQLGGIAANCTVAGENPRSVNVTAGQTATVDFSVSCVSTTPPVNLRIERMYLTQSTQRLTGDVPLVQGRDGFLRVFVTASGSNAARPDVRVRLYQNGSLSRTFTITADRSSTPTSVQEETLGDSWNLNIPGSLITTRTSIVADVDPGNELTETNESDNSYPVSGSPQALQVQGVPHATIRFVPILQTSNGLQASVGDPGQLVELVRRMYPLNGLTTEVRSVFSVAGPLQPSDQNGQWGQILSDVEALRVMEAPDRTYYGLVRLDYDNGIVGNGFVAAPSAIGTDNPGDARRILAHELGHTWGELHTPCGEPPGVDPQFPYRSGNIGVYGYDAGTRTLKLPSIPDVMGYCENPWVSDYVYERVMSYRRSNPLTPPASSLSQPCMLVWGRIVNGIAVLEPTFQIVARPHLPKTPGPYTLEARALDGTSLFSFSFNAIATGNDPDGSKHFAFAVPLDVRRASQLSSVRLSGPGAQMTALARSGAAPTSVSPDEIILKRDPGGVSLTWNSYAHPMVIVRDPHTREVLSFARGGRARVWSQQTELELELSDGVRSQAIRRAISR
ncbi:MAG TPA: hypothetical protein VHH32_01915 [Gemmatimonadales bacterium]|nr:hypothetical protein [Gemmatimonadales bacterium]